MMFGGLALGFVPMFGITFNGFIVGITLALNSYNNRPLAFFLSAILPHGIFGIPAILVGGAFGLRIGYELIFASNESLNEKLKRNLHQSIFSLTVFVPISLIAAIIDSCNTIHTEKNYLKFVKGERGKSIKSVVYY